MKVTFEVVRGAQGPSLYVGDDSSGYRLAGPKPYGGGEVVHSFKVDIEELREELAALEATVKETK